MEIRDGYRDHIPVYTDGSRDGNAMACTTVFPSNTVISMRLPDSASVFTAAVWAIIKALEQIKISSASKYIVFTDSLLCLQALHHMKLEHPLIGMVIRKCVFLNIAKKDIVSTWQDDWNGAVTNKLHSVKPVLGEWQSSYRRCRKDEVVLCRVHIGHTHLTHSYILKKDPPPVCEHCQCNLTVRHILVECNHFAQERKDIFGRRNVVESFRFQPTLIVLFLKQIQFYYTF